MILGYPNIQFRNEYIDKSCSWIKVVNYWDLKYVTTIVVNTPDHFYSIQKFYEPSPPSNSQTNTYGTRSS